ncbi:MAG: hypothetical protein R3B82_18345 [Sandaracinaceae bacterium]
MLDRRKRLIDGLVVYPENLRANSRRPAAFWASEGVLLARPRGQAAAGGQAYVWVQRNAMRAFHGEGAFLDFLLADEDIRSLLEETTIREQLDLEHALSSCATIIDRALAEATS